MNKTFETIEIIAHKAIEYIGNTAIGIVKAVTTLLCLGGSLAYESGQKLEEFFYKDKAASTDANPDANNDVSSEQEVVPVDVDIEQVEEFSQEMSTTNNDVVVVTSPIVKANSIEGFVSNGLKDKLSENYLAATTYRLPNNKRVRTKTHKRFKDLGVMKEHYPILMATGTLR